jgi:hypothetical protein
LWCGGYWKELPELAWLDWLEDTAESAWDDDGSESKEVSGVFESETKEAVFIKR